MSINYGITKRIRVKVIKEEVKDAMDYIIRDQWYSMIDEFMEDYNRNKEKGSKEEFLEYLEGHILFAFITVRMNGIKQKMNEFIEFLWEGTEY